MSAVLDTFFIAMERLMDQRRELQARLASTLQQLQARGMGPASAAAASDAGEKQPPSRLVKSSSSSSSSSSVGSQDTAAEDFGHDELLDEISANMLREDRVWNTAAWALKLMVSEHQLGTASVHSWPFTTRFVQITAAKFKRDGAARDFGKAAKGREL